MEAVTKPDITTEEDIKTMVTKFYDKVNNDELLSPVFNDFSKVNWPDHLPKMFQFWNFLILGIEGYSGRPFPIHMALPVNKAHFERWISLFKANMDENFAGPNAELGKYKAENIALTFQYRMELLP